MCTGSTFRYRKTMSLIDLVSLTEHSKNRIYQSKFQCLAPKWSIVKYRNVTLPKGFSLTIILHEAEYIWLVNTFNYNCRLHLHCKNLLVVADPSVTGGEFAQMHSILTYQLPKKEVLCRSDQQQQNKLTQAFIEFWGWYGPRTGWFQLTFVLSLMAHGR